MTTADAGLRARKKAATRAALGRAAARLTAERGMEGVTVEAIAEKAGVSPRTFHNYFGGKEDAVVSVLTDEMATMIDRLRARPAAEPVWDSLHAVARDAVAGHTGEGHGFDVMDLMRLVKADPTLVASQLHAISEMQDRIADVIAERTGTDTGRDPLPKLLAGASGLALHTATDLWIDGRAGDRSPADLVDEAFALLRAGLPIPGPVS